MPTSLGPAEILVILVVALIVLGPERLPKAARQIGKAVAEVRHWSGGIHDEVRKAFDDTDTAPKSTAAPESAAAPEQPADRATDAPPAPAPAPAPPADPTPGPAPGAPGAPNLPSSN